MDVAIVTLSLPPAGELTLMIGGPDPGLVDPRKMPKPREGDERNRRLGLKIDEFSGLSSGPLVNTSRES